MRPFNFDTFATTAYTYASQDLLEGCSCSCYYFNINFKYFYFTNIKIYFKGTIMNNFFEIDNVTFIASKKNKVSNVTLKN